MPDEYGIYATNCSHPINYGRYIEDFKCLEESGNRLLKEMRLSFPSGHSSFSMYTMLYCAVSTHTDPSFFYLFIEPFPFWSYSFFFLYRFFARHTHTHTTDLSAIADDMARIKAIETFYAVSTTRNDMVHMHVTYLGLQTSLVWCVGWRINWRNICHCCCKF